MTNNLFFKVHGISIEDADRKGRVNAGYYESPFRLQLDGCSSPIDIVVLATQPITLGKNSLDLIPKEYVDMGHSVFRVKDINYVNSRREDYLHDKLMCIFGSLKNL